MKAVDFLGILPRPDARLPKVTPKISWTRDFVVMDLGNFIGRR